MAFEINYEKSLVKFFSIFGFKMIIYSIISVILLLLLSPVILLLLILSEKRRKTFFHRLFPKPNCKDLDRPVWVHALSVGETISAIPLIEKISQNLGNKKIVFSVSTLTGYNIAQKEIAPFVAEIFYFPYDIFFSVKMAFNRINPRFCIIVESDIWPIFLRIAKKRKIKTVLVNGRLSEGSLHGYQKFRFFFLHVFNSFTAILTQSQEDSQRFASLGIEKDKITTIGNIKFDRNTESISDARKHELKQLLGLNLHDNKVVIAGSTHDGEEVIILGTLLRMKNIFSVIVPRNPARAGSVVKLAKGMGYSATLYSELESNFESVHQSAKNSGQAFRHDINRPKTVIVDRIGLLNSLYSIADLAYIGGSLVDEGGHNPLEPAAYGKPILFGEHMEDFREIARLLLERRGAVSVKNGDELFLVINSLICDKIKHKNMGENAMEVFNDNKGATDRAVERILLIIGNHSNGLC